MFKNSKKGFIGVYIIFMVFSLLILIIAAVLVPLSIRMNTEFTAAGARIINSSIDKIDAIDDANIRTELRGAMTDAISASAQNIEIQAAIFQYSWIIIVVIMGLFLFLYTRQLVEYQQGGSGLI
jgi:hypothetical protein